MPERRSLLPPLWFTLMLSGVALADWLLDPGAWLVGAGWGLLAAYLLAAVTDDRKGADDAD